MPELDQIIEREVGLLFARTTGVSDEERTVKFLARLEKYLKVATPENPTRIILDAAGVSKITSKGRANLVKLNHNERFGAIEIVNAPRVLRVLAGFIEKATQRGGSKICTSVEEAAEWLNSLQFSFDDVIRE